MSTPSLNHLVSRFLTKPWENKERYLYFYDFAKGQIQRTSSEKLYTKEDAFDSTIEIRFRDLIETPLSAYIAELRKGNKTSLGEKFEVVRAIHLIFLGQAARIAEAVDRETKSLTSLLEMDDNLLHAFLTISMEDSRILIAPVENGKLLYYPENGIFSFPVMDAGCPTKWTYGIAIPATLTRAIILVSKTVKDESLKDVAIAELSIGPDNCNRVVIPALIAEQADRNYAIESMKIHRDLGKQIIDTSHSIRLLARQLHEKMGLSFEKVRGSFHNKVKIVYPGKN